MNTVKRVAPAGVRPVLRWAAWLLAGALLLSVAWLARAEAMRPLGDLLAGAAAIFLGIFIEAVPFLLLGTISSAMVEVFLPREWLARWAPRSALPAAVCGGLMGLAFPVCECGVVPLTRRLLNKGLPLPAGVTFLLAAPALNPIVIASTVAAFGVGTVLFLRLGLTLVVAITTGLVFALARPDDILRSPSGRPAIPLALAATASGGEPVRAPGPRAALAERLRRVLVTSADEFFEMAPYLVAGALLATLLQTIVPSATLLAVASGPIVSVPVAIGLAVVLSVCSTVDAFIALAFGGTLTTGAILAFLTFGPMVDIKSTLMFLQVFRRRAVAYLILVPLALTILLTLWINLYTNW